MAQDFHKILETFYFRDLHSNVFMGTASDRYAGWIGQIYSKERYQNSISVRPKTIGGKTLQVEVLPVESVEEYFKHFSVLELDFTFYSLLLDKDLRPTQNYHVLRTYRKYLGKDGHVILKVPQVIFAQRLWRGGAFTENPDYLNSELFTHQFYKPAVDLLGDTISGFIFEQEYQAKKERISPDEYAATLDGFLDNIPEDNRYHIETRTESMLRYPYFQVLRKYGVGQVLSHWTWLPPLRKQFALSARTFLNAGNKSIIRLMTPLQMRYDEAYVKAHPFNQLIDEMMSPQMIEDTVKIMAEAVDRGVDIGVIVNNRAGGNAPRIAQKISERFLQAYSQEK
ncbi:MAG: DUF72 domain-containing protein [Deltaproteobacteria bacterium]|nr:DUF72 domain-containing protein [Deltaproteobacteria bacterium]MBW2342021.1 DUF72 domain-containing protein [Deltaproteobacteria bacterium]